MKSILLADLGVVVEGAEHNLVVLRELLDLVEDSLNMVSWGNNIVSWDNKVD